jgi:hypothetical protein
MTDSQDSHRGEEGIKDKKDRMCLYTRSFCPCPYPRRGLDLSRDSRSCGRLLACSLVPGPGPQGCPFQAPGRSVRPLRWLGRDTGLLAWHVPLSPGTGRLEQGRRQPSGSVGVALAGALGVDWLAFLEGPEARFSSVSGRRHGESFAARLSKATR